MSDELIKAKLYFHGSAWCQADWHFSESVSISFDQVERFDRRCKYKVLVLIEPPEILDKTEYFIQHRNQFDLILAWNEDVLNKCPNARQPIILGGCWIDHEDLKNKWASGVRKTNEVSYIMSNKRLAPGHELRWQIWNEYENANRIMGKGESFRFQKYLTIAANGNDPRIGQFKNILFEKALYHIAIENVARPNWITEKVIDCFATKTIPIYYGAPNIGQYFNPDGIIQINSLEDLKIQLSNLTTSFYDHRLDAIEENYEKAKQYFSWDDRIHKAINQFIKETTI